MTDREILELILSEIAGMKAEIADIKAEITGIKAEIADMKADISGMKAEIADMKADIQELKYKVGELEFHIENNTDKNIQLIAENFVDLTRKLNQAIPVADKNLAYEVKVGYLINEVKTLRRDVDNLRSASA